MILKYFHLRKLHKYLITYNNFIKNKSYIIPKLFLKNQYNNKIFKLIHHNQRLKIKFFKNIYYLNKSIIN